MDAALPNIAVREVREDMAWTFTLTPSRQHWSYRGNRKILGFDPIERMFYLGHTGANEDVWIAMFPNECVGPNGVMEEFKPSSLPTRIPTKAAYVLWAYIAFVLARIQFDDFAVDNEYPDISSATTLGFYTDIL